ncbi:Zinc finger protein 16 [Operophtera brumata]|uniref:Zinc finger protein 16 n=1 Tax=Operophtera brumata TaxID=104452 RepID=A0A0L7LVK6_OPEBR|nr:Zinc finger protein 16 [Operophtera brumata]
MQLFKQQVKRNLADLLQKKRKKSKSSDGILAIEDNVAGESTDCAEDNIEESHTDDNKESREQSNYARSSNDMFFDCKARSSNDMFFDCKARSSNDMFFDCKAQSSNDMFFDCKARSSDDMFFDCKARSSNDMFFDCKARSSNDMFFDCKARSSNDMFFDCKARSSNDMFFDCKARSSNDMFFDCKARSSNDMFFDCKARSSDDMFFDCKARSSNDMYFDCKARSSNDMFFDCKARSGNGVKRTRNMEALPDRPQCQECGKAVDDGELYCALCDKTFASVATYRQHLRISRRHVPETEFRFVNKTRLRDHVDWEHLHRIKFRCQLCEKNAAKLKYHITAMHSGETPYRCVQCAAAFGWYSSLYRHMREVHYKVRTQYDTCARCTTRYVHSTTHARGALQGTYRCVQCVAAFGWYSSLYRPMREVHYKVRTAVCSARARSDGTRHCTDTCARCTTRYVPLCAVRGRVRMVLVTVLTHARGALQGTYRCVQCAAAFGWYSSLYRHMREVHYKVRTQYDTCARCTTRYVHSTTHARGALQGTYRCVQCVAAFGWYSSLYRHMREVHYKVRTQYDTCARCTTRYVHSTTHARGALQGTYTVRHMREVHYKCVAAFGWYSSLYRHMREVHYKVRTQYDTCARCTTRYVPLCAVRGRVRMVLVTVPTHARGALQDTYTVRHMREVHYKVRTQYDTCARCTRRYVPLCAVRGRVRMVLVTVPTHARGALQAAALRSALAAALRSALAAALRSALAAALRSALAAALRSALRSALAAALRSALATALRSARCSARRLGRTCVPYTALVLC